eukprot:15285188-Alexandrium_andersonii.AAC.1
MRQSSLAPLSLMRPPMRSGAAARPLHARRVREEISSPASAHEEMHEKVLAMRNVHNWQDRHDEMRHFGS